MRLCLSANYVSGCPPNMAQVSVWAGNLHPTTNQRQLPTNPKKPQHKKHSILNLMAVSHGKNSKP